MALSLISCVRLALVTLLARGVTCLLACAFSRDPRYIESPLIGRQAPSFRLTLFDGQSIRLEDPRGKVLFLTFRASCCPPCRAKAKTLEPASKKYKDRRAVLLSINIQDTEEAGRAFIQEFAITYLNGRDDTGRIAIDYGVWVPETSPLDQQGRVTCKHVGELPITIANLHQALLSIVSADTGKGEYRSVR